jgi:hypothetical protein
MNNFLIVKRVRQEQLARERFFFGTLKRISFFFYPSRINRFELCTFNSYLIKSMCFKFFKGGEINYEGIGEASIYETENDNDSVSHSFSIKSGLVLY